jgi:large subunit ribosomal protein L4
VNKKMKRGALRSALSDAVSSGKLAVIDEIGFDEPRTKDAAAILQALGLQGKVLVVLPEPETTVEKSFRNLHQVRLTFARSLSVYDVLAADRVLFSKPALEALAASPQAPAGEEDAS